MAKRKTHHKKHRKHSRKVGALNPSSGMTKLISLAAGYFLADTINPVIDKVVPATVLSSTTAAKYIPAAAEIGLGGYLLMKKGKASMLKTVAGGVVAGAGIKRMLRNTGTITGYQSVPVIGAARKHVAGYQSVPVIGAMPAQLNGVPEQLSGYRVNGLGAYLPQGSGSNVMGSVKNPAPVIAMDGSSDYMK